MSIMERTCEIAASVGNAALRPLRIYGWLAVALSIVVTLTGCWDDNKLTDEMAKRAIIKWLAGTGTVSSISGIHEIPEKNIAEVEVVFQNFRYRRILKTGIEWGERFMTSRDYSGVGKATFVRYNDGAWSLKEVRVPDPEVLLYGRTKWTIKERIDTQ